MPVRTFMLLLLGLLVVVALGFAVENLRQHWKLYRDVSVMVDRSRAVDQCLRAIAAFIHERGRTNFVLRAQAPIDEETRGSIESYRAAANGAIGALLADFPAGARGKTDALRRALETLGSLRGQVDRDLSLPLAARDRQLPGKWMAESDAFLTQAEEVLNGLSWVPGNFDARFAHVNNLIALALKFKILEGSETALLGAELASRDVPSKEAIALLNRIHGQLIQVWSMFEAERAKYDHPQLLPFVEQAHTAAFQRLQPLQEEILRIAQTGLPTTAFVAPYLQASGQALHAAHDLIAALSALSRENAQRLLGEARREMIVSGLLIVATLILAGLLAGFMKVRFFGPLNEIVGRVDKLVRAQTGLQQHSPSRDPADELSKVQRALGLLDEAIEVRMRSEAALKESESISISILSCAPQAIVLTDSNGLIAVFSPGAEKMLGYAADEVVGQATPVIFHDPVQMRERAEKLAQDFALPVYTGFDLFVNRLRSMGEPDEDEWILLRKDGSRLTAALTQTFLRNAGGEISGYLCVATDVTERAVASARIAQMAYYDHLTGLPNSRLMHDRLNMAIAQSRREMTRLAVLLIDLDKFKPVNDNYGHFVGDLLLHEAAKRMQSCMRGSDTLARVGGDEFVAVLVDVTSERDALRVAEKIRLNLCEPFDLEGGYVLSIACSIGVAIFPEHGVDGQHLLKSADEAMYVAKDAGRNCVCVAGQEAAKNGLPVSRLDAEAYILRLVWHKSLECGEPVIDNAHRGMFVMANRLLQSFLHKTGDNEFLLQQIDEIIQEIGLHFANEEQILADYGYQELAAQCSEHRQLLARAQELRNLAAAGKLGVGDLLAFIVHDVVSEHLLESDKAFFEFLQKIGDAQKMEANADRGL